MSYFKDLLESRKIDKNLSEMNEFEGGDVLNSFYFIREALNIGYLNFLSGYQDEKKLCENVLMNGAGQGIDIERFNYDCVLRLGEISSKKRNKINLGRKLL